MERICDFSDNSANTAFSPTLGKNRFWFFFNLCLNYWKVLIMKLDCNCLPSIAGSSAFLRCSDDQLTLFELSNSATSIHTNF